MRFLWADHKTKTKRPSLHMIKTCIIPFQLADTSCTGTSCRCRPRWCGARDAWHSQAGARPVHRRHPGRIGRPGQAGMMRQKSCCDGHRARTCADCQGGHRPNLKQ